MISKFSATLLSLSRPIKRLVVLTVDAFLCAVSVWLAISVRLDSWGLPHGNQWVAIGLSLLFAIPVFVISGLYRSIFRYAGLRALLTVCKAVLIYGFFYFAVLTLLALPYVPRSVGITQPLMLLVSVGLSRAVSHYFLSGQYVSRLYRKTLPNVLIYGAGVAGHRLAEALSTGREMRVIGFLDDDERLHGQNLNGLTVFDPRTLRQIVSQHDISTVLLAIPAATRQRRNEILELVRKAHVAVRTLPSFMELAQGTASLSDVNELDLEDLLGRDVVPPIASLFGKNICGKVVLVTGAGGSIGSELCRQIIKAAPSTLLLVEVSEFALYAVHQDLLQLLNQKDAPQIQLIPLLASVRDTDRMQKIITTWRPQTIYHAAAYKHVPMVEHNPAEGIKNNVFGTIITAQLAAKHGVSDFVLISTDKAVRPTNIMGASKRLAEMALQAMAGESANPLNNTKFSMVRFGNVLGSSGSVVPLFRKQIKAGGPITLTHEEITRYFMTIPEAAQLVIQAGAMATGGDVFVLDMGEPVRIIDLACRMVELSGLSLRDKNHPQGDIGIEITGLRPGEKLFEELLIGDKPLPTLHPRIMKAHEEYLPWSKLELYLNEMMGLLESNDVIAMRTLLKELVPGYQPEGEVVDWLHLEHLCE